MRATEQPQALVFADVCWLSRAGLSAGVSGFQAAVGEIVEAGRAMHSQKSRLLVVSMILLLSVVRAVAIPEIVKDWTVWVAGGRYGIAVREGFWLDVYFGHEQLQFTNAQILAVTTICLIGIVVIPWWLRRARRRADQRVSPL